MVVDTNVGEMLGHVGDDVPLGQREQVPTSRQLEAQQGIAVLEPLGPLRPATRGIAPGDGDDGGTVAHLPTPVEAQCFFRSQLKRALDSRGQILSLQGVIGLQPGSFGVSLQTNAVKRSIICCITWSGSVSQMTRLNISTSIG